LGINNGGAVECVSGVVVFMLAILVVAKDKPVVNAVDPT
jgi:hypothetical protein